MIEINQDFADGVLHSRNPETNKNDYGRILCVCGSAGYTGAAYFSAQGAVRMGSGVVTLAVPQGAWPVLAVKLNEPVVRPMPQDENGLFSMDEAACACRKVGRAAHRVRTRPFGYADRNRVYPA